MKALESIGRKLPETYTGPRRLDHPKDSRAHVGTRFENGAKGLAQLLDLTV